MRTAVLPILLATTLANAAPVPAAPAAVPAPGKPVAKPAEEPIPKAKVNAAGKKQDAKLPSFLGMFGPVSLVKQLPFRASPGRYVEFVVEGLPKEAEVGAFRVAELGPALKGARWLEMTGAAMGLGTQGVRIQARGVEDANVERMIVVMPGFPPMELPIDQYEIVDDGPDAHPEAPTEGAAAFSGMQISPDATSRKASHEKITVPLGTFDCDHWILESPGHRHDYWITADPSVPFLGTVKVTDGKVSVVAQKVGTDATARINVPPRSR